MSAAPVYWTLIACGLGVAVAVGATGRPGVPAPGPWTCPESHPIKGYLGESGRVYFVPGGVFYDEASPERCYASEDEARHDGGRPVGEPGRSVPGGLVNLQGRIRA